jgi:hypothetical protein
MVNKTQSLVKKKDKDKECNATTFQWQNEMLSQCKKECDSILEMLYGRLYKTNNHFTEKAG